MKKSTLFSIVFFTFIVLVLCYQFYRESYESKVLEQNNQTFGFLSSCKHGSSRFPSTGTIKYNVKGRNYDFTCDGDFSFMKLGDTILIEYATKDHSVARLIDKYYMKKYWHLKKEHASHSLSFAKK